MLEVALAKKGGTTVQGADSRLGPQRKSTHAPTFTVGNSPTTYDLIATKPGKLNPSHKAQIKLMKDVTNGPGTLVTVLKESHFTTQAAKDAFNAYQGKANAFATAMTPPRQNTNAQLPQGGIAALAAQQAELETHEHALVPFIQDGTCTALNGGCFAAGTKLWTPDGYRTVESIFVGEPVFSQDQFRPDGLIEAKPVEKIFRRLAEVTHLHLVEGQLIRTTKEHPFYVHERGWTPVAEINQGDWLLTDTGHWQQVEEVYDTGELEVVYNLRVADHHTYFVGDDGWGWSLWAHNAYTVQKLQSVSPNSGLEGRGKWRVIPQGINPAIRPNSVRQVKNVFGNLHEFQTRNIALRVAIDQHYREENALRPTDEGGKYEAKVRSRYAVTLIAESIYRADGSNWADIDFQTTTHIYEVGLSFSSKLNQLIKYAIIARARGMQFTGIHKSAANATLNSYIYDMTNNTFGSEIAQAIQHDGLGYAIYSDSQQLVHNFHGFTQIN